MSNAVATIDAGTADVAAAYFDRLFRSLSTPASPAMHRAPQEHLMPERSLRPLRWHALMGLIIEALRAPRGRTASLCGDETRTQRHNMAKLDDLIEQVDDPALRSEIEQAAHELRRRKVFGLVFEEHIPEITLLRDFPVKPGSTVYRREDTSAKHPLTVAGVDGNLATVVGADGDSEDVGVDDLVILRRFGDPIYPTLAPVGTIERGNGRPFHAVIESENYHALQLLQFMYEGQVDCIYADPPYNTGARDWKYNNDYVDQNDRWRHSKWLSMLEKRLQLAKRLLKPDGVLIVTIDENEVHHLGMLLEQIFPRARRQMVTICIQPSGASGVGLSRVEEYAIFCFLGDAEPVRTPDDMLIGASDPDGDGAGGTDEALTWESLLRRGNAWYRARRKNLCYPVVLNEDATRIVRAGLPFEGEDESARPREIDGQPLAWPVRKDGRLGIWRVDGARLNYLAERGYAHVAGRDDSRDTWALRYLLSGTVSAIEADAIEITGRGDRGEVVGRVIGSRRKVAKTMWYRGRHNAGGSGGTQLLNALLGESDVFSFPKSVYSVRDCLQVAIGDRSDALVLDFFAGSGTTLHATCLLNASDEGTRRCVMVTNNEVEDQLARKLHGQAIYSGDVEYDRHGIFDAACRPRCTAALTGRRPDGEPAAGKYLDGGAYADGFAENCVFLRMKYLEPDEIELGRQFAAFVPILWLASGGLGPQPDATPANGYLLPSASPFAVLLRESAFRGFAEALAERPDVTHVWLVADSERAFADMRSALPGDYAVAMLYRDYLRTFAMNTLRSA
jgi:adenine-specific DNA-methyltransferase